MMKYVLVGDIHGKVPLVEKALARLGHKVFVGDFMDSYDRPANDMGKCIELVLAAIRAGEASAIFGNHELSYLMPNVHRCSGYSYKNESFFVPLANDVSELFKSHIMLSPNVLVTHAGLTRHMWDKYKLTLENVDEQLTEWFKDHTGKSPIHHIGRRRGGFDTVGGTFWCDFNSEFVPVPGLTQVFGHTAGKAIRRLEDSYCIDCLDNRDDFLEIEL